MKRRNLRIARLRRHIARTALAVMTCAVPAHALPLGSIGPTTLNEINPTTSQPWALLQDARLARSGIASTWASPKTFPGITGLGSQNYNNFAFREFDIAIPAGYDFIQITFGDLDNTALLFASAYEGSYNPQTDVPAIGAGPFGLDTHYLGDEGASGNLPNGAWRQFQVQVLPTTVNLVIVVNNTIPFGSSPDIGLTSRFQISVDGFTDLAQAAASPEPGTMSLAFFALLAAAGYRSRKRNH